MHLPFMLSWGSVPCCHVQLGSEWRLGSKLTQNSQEQTSQASSPAGAIPCFELRNQQQDMSQCGCLGCGVAGWNKT